jgi:hypothetical protein
MAPGKLVANGKDKSYADLALASRNPDPADHPDPAFALTAQGSLTSPNEPLDSSGGHTWLKKKNSRICFWIP